MSSAKSSTKAQLAAQRSMIVWTLAAIFIVGAGVFMSLMTPPSPVLQQIALEKAKLLKADQARLVQAADRSPASAAPEYSALAIDDKGQQAIDFTLPCDTQTGRFSTAVVQVRLSGKLCGPRGKADPRSIASSEITNVTNGFSATVFYVNTGSPQSLKQNSFTTDYISLMPGDNQIRILHSLRGGGRVERDFLIERQ